MSCFRLELPPAKKAWKSFTSKLQSKLRKLHGFKAIKKRETRLHATATKAPISPFPISEQRMRRKKHLLLPSHQGIRLRSHQRDLFKKKAAPVYIDWLFKEPSVAELVAKYPPSAKNVKLLDQEQEEEGKAAERVTNSKELRAGGCAADDMWESLALASPQMNGIDQRAEEFIKRFRAEMKLQETMARRL